MNEYDVPSTGQSLLFKLDPTLSFELLLDSENSRYGLSSTYVTHLALFPLIVTFRLRQT